MAKTTFSGPVISKNGFQNLGPDMTVSLTADTSLTVATHAGKILLCNDADGKFTLPSIYVNANGATAGDNEFNNLNNIGAQFKFFVETAATDMDIKTDGTDKFYGAIYTGIDDSAGGKTFISDSSSNDVLTMNGSTKGGLAGSWVQFTAIADNAYYVTGQLLGSSTLVTPFADA